MSYPLIGALAGLVFATAVYFLSGGVIRRSDARADAGGSAKILDMIRKARTVPFAAAGWTPARCWNEIGR